MIDVGLLLVRVVVGGLLAAHGLQKLTGWFQGPGIAGHAGLLETLGYRRPRQMAWLHGLSETAAGLMLALGVLTPLASAAIIAVMLNAAVAVHARNGLWVQQGGYEYPLVLSVAAASIAVAGPGAIALDAWAGWDLSGMWGAAGIGLGVVIGAAALATRRATSTAEPRSDDRRSQRRGLTDPGEVQA